MIKTTKILLIFISTMLSVAALAALPETPLDMDGDHADWTGAIPATCFADEGGVDDANLDKADVTEYCLHIDSELDGGLYLLMAIDDTQPNKADARIVIDMNGDLLPDYSVNNMLDYHPQNGLSTEGVSVNQCDNEDGACDLNSLTSICGDRNGACTGVSEGFGNDWPSEFTSSSCDGANCTTQDGFMEMFVPWEYLGGEPPESYLFGLYLSAHSGGTEDSSADITGYGLACDNSGCYPSSPSAVTLQSFSGVSVSGVELLFGLPFLLLLFFGSGRLMTKRFK